MAENDESGGLDYHFVEEPPDSLVCPVCLLPCREPHLISCCGKKVCQSCISRVQLAGQPCPLCRTPEFATMIDKEIERQVLSLKVYCNNKQDGCTWIGELRQLERHLNSCNVSCKYKCGLCCPRQQMLIHERDECELRPEIVLTKTIDELTKRVADLESTCKNQSFVIKRQKAVIQLTAKENKANVEISTNKVAFISVPGAYKPGKSVQVRYQLFPGLVTHNRDWVGLFKVGWTSNRDYYTFEWAPYKSQEEEDEDGESIRIVKFSGSRIPPDDGNFYQLCYVTYSGVVKGASHLFQFSNSAKNTCHDDLEVENEDSLLLLRTRHETEVTELQKKVQLLTQNNQQLLLDQRHKENEIHISKELVEKLDAEKQAIIAEKEETETQLRIQCSQLEECLRKLDEEKETLVGRSEYYQAQLESVQQRLDVAQAQIATLEQKMNSVAQDLDKEKADNQELRKQLAAKESEVNIMQQNICEMAGRIEEPCNRLSKEEPYSNKVDRQVLEALQLAYDQGHKEDEVYALKELVDKLDAELKESQTKHDERIAEKNLAIENLQESLETKETALNGLKRKETAMKRSIEVLNVENGQLKRQILNLKKDLGNHTPPQHHFLPRSIPVHNLPSETPQPLPQRSQQSQPEGNCRQCPVCNLTFPSRISQQDFEHHVSSHFH